MQSLLAKCSPLVGTMLNNEKCFRAPNYFYCSWVLGGGAGKENVIRRRKLQHSVVFALTILITLSEAEGPQSPHSQSARPHAVQSTVYMRVDFFSFAHMFLFRQMGFNVEISAQIGEELVLRYELFRNGSRVPVSKRQQQTVHGKKLFRCSFSCAESTFCHKPWNNQQLKNVHHEHLEKFLWTATTISFPTLFCFWNIPFDVFIWFDVDSFFRFLLVFFHFLSQKSQFGKTESPEKILQKESLQCVFLGLPPPPNAASTENQHLFLFWLKWGSALEENWKIL